MLLSRGGVPPLRQREAGFSHPIPRHRCGLSSADCLLLQGVVGAEAAAAISVFNLASSEPPDIWWMSSSSLTVPAA